MRLTGAHLFVTHAAAGGNHVKDLVMILLFHFIKVIRKLIQMF